jgi:hypothetical protein
MNQIISVLNVNSKAFIPTTQTSKASYSSNTNNVNKKFNISYLDCHFLYNIEYLSFQT